MSEIKDGLLIDPMVKQNVIAFIEHQVLDLKKIQAVVVHQTETVSAKKTFEVWQTKNTGAHFVIDRGGDETHTGVDGVIYQTARLNRVCWHVGFLQSKCFIANSCEVPSGKKVSLEAAAETIKSPKQRNSAVNKIESGKSYPARFPNNYDSIGIEVVTKYDYKNKVYPPPSKLQILAVSYLLEQLIANIPAITFGEDIYEHGSIARKEPSEGTRTITVYTDIKAGAASYLKEMMPKK